MKLRLRKRLKTAILLVGIAISLVSGNPEGRKNAKTGKQVGDRLEVRRVHKVPERSEFHNDPEVQKIFDKDESVDDSGALRTLRSFHLTMGEREMDTMLMMMLRNAIFEVEIDDKALDVQEGKAQSNQVKSGSTPNPTKQLKIVKQSRPQEQQLLHHQQKQVQFNDNEENQNVQKQKFVQKQQQSKLVQQPLPLPQQHRQQPLEPSQTNQRNLQNNRGSQNQKQLDPQRAEEQQRLSDVEQRVRESLIRHEEERRNAEVKLEKQREKQAEKQPELRSQEQEEKGNRTRSKQLQQRDQKQNDQPRQAKQFQQKPALKTTQVQQKKLDAPRAEERIRLTDQERRVQEQLIRQEKERGKIELQLERQRSIEAKNDQQRQEQIWLRKQEEKESRPLLKQQRPPKQNDQSRQAKQFQQNPTLKTGQIQPARKDNIALPTTNGKLTQGVQLQNPSSKINLNQTIRQVPSLPKGPPSVSFPSGILKIAKHPQVPISNQIDTSFASSSNQKLRFGKAFLTLPSEVPATSFACSDQQYPGLYADPEADCQVFHMCQINGRYNSFLCPEGTSFDQRHFVCNWKSKVNCGESVQYYSLNKNIYS